MTGGQRDNTARRITLCHNGAIISDGRVISVLTNMCYHIFSSLRLFIHDFDDQKYSSLSLSFPASVSSFDADVNIQGTFYRKLFNMVQMIHSFLVQRLSAAAGLWLQRYSEITRLIRRLLVYAI